MHPIRVAGVVPVGGDSLAAAVCESVPDLLLLYSADTSQDAAGHLPATGNAMLSGRVLSTTAGGIYGNYELMAS